LRLSARAAKSRTDGERDLGLLASIAVPTLVVHGTGDLVLSTDHGYALAAAMPGSELAIIEGMGHDVQPHYAPAILDRLLPLLERNRRK
jgi:pimeloyl-ACP methyl ester carboxylesterase